nr:UDP-N-acetylmuramoyl-L-alanyl-D-glutamate--2,6-diaminopimelate ligase MurE homolog, chloroplastic [Ipomoea batatas]
MIIVAPFHPASDKDKRRVVGSFNRQSNAVVTIVQLGSFKLRAWISRSFSMNLSGKPSYVREISIVNLNRPETAYFNSAGDSTGCQKQERQYSKEQVIRNPGFISQVSSDDAYVNSGGGVGYVNDKRMQSTVELEFELRLASCYLFFRLKSELVFDGHLCLSEADKRGDVAVVASKEIDIEETLGCKALVIVENTNVALAVLAVSFYRKKIGGAILIVDALPMDEKHATAFGLMKIGEEGRIIEFVEKPKGEQLKLDGLVMVPLSSSKRSFYEGPILQLRTKKASQRSVCC